MKDGERQREGREEGVRRVTEGERERREGETVRGGEGERERGRETGREREIDRKTGGNVGQMSTMQHS